MPQPLIIFGAGKIAQAATFLGKPLLTTEELPGAYPPAEHALFVALGYQGVNRLRADKLAWARDQGYRLASYRSPLASGDYQMGENSIVMDGAVIQPAATLGDDVFVWGGTMIGHHDRPPCPHRRSLLAHRQLRRSECHHRPPDHAWRALPARRPHPNQQAAARRHRGHRPRHRAASAQCRPVRAAVGVFSELAGHASGF